MRKTIRTGVLLLLSALLAACATAVRQPPPAPAPTLPPLPAASTKGAKVYTVSPRDSSLDILVFRGGTLAKLGHNHVVSATNVSGRLWVHPQFERSGFELSFPVRELIVDDAQSRRAAGAEFPPAEFPPDVPQSDKDGTRRNMLSPAVLDAERYPAITLRSARIGGSLDSPRITARITIKDVSRDVEVPARLTLSGGRLTASGEFDILQSNFGIKPFSAALGALEVQDRLHLKFKIVAVKERRDW